MDDTENTLQSDFERFDELCALSEIGELLLDYFEEIPENAMKREFINLADDILDDPKARQMLGLAANTN